MSKPLISTALICCIFMVTFVYGEEVSPETGDQGKASRKAKHREWIKGNFTECCEKAKRKDGDFSTNMNEAINAYLVEMKDRAMAKMQEKFGGNFPMSSGGPGFPSMSSGGPGFPSMSSGGPGFPSMSSGGPGFPSMSSGGPGFPSTASGGAGILSMLSGGGGSPQTASGGAGILSMLSGAGGSSPQMPTGDISSFKSMFQMPAGTGGGFKMPAGSGGGFQMPMGGRGGSQRQGGPGGNRHHWDPEKMKAGKCFFGEIKGGKFADVASAPEDCKVFVEERFKEIKARCEEKAKEESSGGQGQMAKGVGGDLQKKPTMEPAKDYWA